MEGERIYGKEHVTYKNGRVWNGLVKNIDEDPEFLIRKEAIPYYHCWSIEVGATIEGSWLGLLVLRGKTVLVVRGYDIGIMEYFDFLNGTWYAYFNGYLTASSTNRQRISYGYVYPGSEFTGEIGTIDSFLINNEIYYWNEKQKRYGGKKIIFLK